MQRPCLRALAEEVCACFGGFVGSLWTIGRPCGHCGRYPRCRGPGCIHGQGGRVCVSEGEEVWYGPPISPAFCPPSPLSLFQPHLGHRFPHPQSPHAPSVLSPHFPRRPPSSQLLPGGLPEVPPGSTVRDADAVQRTCTAAADPGADGAGRSCGCGAVASECVSGRGGRGYGMLWGRSGLGLRASVSLPLDPLKLLLTCAPRWPRSTARCPTARGGRQLR